MSYQADASPFNDPIPQEPYPAWSSQRQIPMSTEEIEDIFFDLTQKFGFQRDSMRNMVRMLHPNVPSRRLLVITVRLLHDAARLAGIQDVP